MQKYRLGVTSYFRGLVRVLHLVIGCGFFLFPEMVKADHFKPMMKNSEELLRIYVPDAQVYGPHMRKALHLYDELGDVFRPSGPEGVSVRGKRCAELAHVMVEEFRKSDDLGQEDISRGITQGIYYGNSIAGHCFKAFKVFHDFMDEIGMDYGKMSAKTLFIDGRMNMNLGLFAGSAYIKGQKVDREQLREINAAIGYLNKLEELMYDLHQNINRFCEKNVRKGKCRG